MAVKYPYELGIKSSAIFFVSNDNKIRVVKMTIRGYFRLIYSGDTIRQKKGAER